MAKIFPIIKKVVAGVVAAINFMPAPNQVGVKLSNLLTARTVVRLGARLTDRLVGTMLVRPATLLKVILEAKAGVKPALLLRSILTSRERVFPALTFDARRMSLTSRLRLASPLTAVMEVVTHYRPALKLTTAGTLNLLTLSPALGLRSMLISREDQHLAPLLTMRGSGTVKGVVEPAPDLETVLSGRSSASLPATNVVQVVYVLAGDYGSNAVGEDAINSRTDWANDANAVGKRNGTVAQIVSNALGARSGRLKLFYADFPDKADLVITGVFLDFYVSQAGTVLNNGNMILKWSRDVNLVTLQTIVGDIEAKTTPLTFDITAATTWDWTKLNFMQAYVEVAFPAAVTTITGQLDAVQLRVTAEKVDSL